MTVKLHTVNIAGNLHDAARAINRWGWAEYVLTLESTSGFNTVAVFRMPAAKVYEIREGNPAYTANPHHDDYTGPADPYSMFYTGGSERANPESSSAHSPSVSSATAPVLTKTGAASQELATALSQAHAPVAAHSTENPSSDNSTGAAPESGTATTASPSEPAGTIGGAQITGDDEPAKTPAPVPPKPARRKAVTAEKAAADAAEVQQQVERPTLTPESQAAMDNLPAWAR